MQRRSVRPQDTQTKGENTMKIKTNIKAGVRKAGEGQQVY